MNEELQIMSVKSDVIVPWSHQTFEMDGLKWKFEQSEKIAVDDKQKNVILLSS